MSMTTNKYSPKCAIVPFAWFWTIPGSMRAGGQPGAIWRGFANLNDRQQSLLNNLQSAGDQIIIAKGKITQQYLAALTAATGVEFAVFTTGGRRMVVRGGEHNFDGVIVEDWTCRGLMPLL